MQTNIRIILIALIVAVGAGGFFLYRYISQLPAPATSPTNTSQNLYPQDTGQTYIPSQTTSGVRKNKQTTTVDLEAAYTALFERLAAIKIDFTRVTATSSSPEFKSVYALYANDVAQFKKLFPKETDVSIGMSDIDIDGDGVNEIMVYEDMPGYCGSGGCTLDLYKKNGTSWKKLFSTTVQGEVGVANTSTNGMSDLFISLHGDIGSQGTVARFGWNGSTYQQGKTVAQWTGYQFVVVL